MNRSLWLALLAWCLLYVAHLVDVPNASGLMNAVTLALGAIWAAERIDPVPARPTVLTRGRPRLGAPRLERCAPVIPGEIGA